MGSRRWRESMRIERTTVAQSFMFLSFPSASLSLSLSFIALDGLRTRHRMKYKGFNEASLSLSFATSPTHTRTVTHSLSIYSSISLGFFSHSRVLWCHNKTDKRQMVREELLLQGVFSSHLVIQLVSQPVNKSTIYSNSHTDQTSWPGSQCCNSVQ